MVGDGFGGQQPLMNRRLAIVYRRSPMTYRLLADTLARHRSGELLDPRTITACYAAVIRILHRQLRPRVSTLDTQDELLDHLLNYCEWLEERQDRAA